MMKLYLNIKKTTKDEIYHMRSIKTLDDFFNYFNLEKLSKISVILLMIWILIPVLLMFLSLFYDHSSFFSFMFNSSRLTIIWSMMMKQIGYIGFIMVILLIIKSLRNKKVNHISFKTYILSHSVEILLIIFLGWSLITTLFSDNLSISFNGTDYRKDGWLSYLAYGGFYGLGLMLVKKKHFMKYMSSLVVVGSLLSLFLIIGNEQLNELLTFHYKSTVFYNPNHMGYYLVLIILSAAYLAIINPKINIAKTIWYSLFSILVVALIENGSFGSYIAVSFGLLFLLVMTFLMKKNKLIHAISISFLFVGITFIMNIESQFLSQETNHLSEDVVDIIENNENAGSAGSGRWDLWINGLNFMIEKPIFGYGIENLEQAYLDVGISQDRPHNELIQIGASIGVIGLLIYMAALAFHFCEFLRLKNKLPFYTIGLFMVVFGYLVSTLFGNSMFYTTPFFMIIFGISRGHFKLENNQM